jgi:peptidoglycan/LPS O-acetylase OafA/YrhL
MNKPASLYLDVLRLAAALVVFIVHAHYLLPGGMPGPWWLSGLGGEAVTLFFVPS